jgi:hypothetical protein
VRSHIRECRIGTDGVRSNGNWVLSLVSPRPWLGRSGSGLTASPAHDRPSRLYMATLVGQSDHVAERPPKPVTWKGRPELLRSSGRPIAISTDCAPREGRVFLCIGRLGDSCQPDSQIRLYPYGYDLVASRCSVNALSDCYLPHFCGRRPGLDLVSCKQNCHATLCRCQYPP